MKLKIIYLALFLIIIITASATETQIFELNILVDHKCDHPACLEGTNVTFDAYFYNNFGKTIRLNSIILYDINQPKNPLAVHEEEGLFLDPEEEYEFSFTKTITAPKDGSYTFYYVPCVDISIYKEENKYLISKEKEGTICRTDKQSIPVVPLAKVECWDDSECKENEICKMYLYKCRPLNCKIGFVKDQKCISLKPYLVILLIIIIALVVFLRLKTKKALKKPKKKPRKKR